MKVSCRKLFCLLLACLFALTACAQGTGANTDAASAEPVPIEVPPPVEQTNTELNIWYTDYGTSANFLDAAVSLYNQQYPDRMVTAEKFFADGSIENSDAATQQMLTEVMAGSGPDLIFFLAAVQILKKWFGAEFLPIWSLILKLITLTGRAITRPSWTLAAGMGTG